MMTQNSYMLHGKADERILSVGGVFEADLGSRRRL